MKAFAKHKKLNREFPVQEINFVSKQVKCDGKYGGKVEVGICIICPVNEPCCIPVFRFDEVDFRIENDDKPSTKEK